jgi:hypothetical protein
MIVGVAGQLTEAGLHRAVYWSVSWPRRRTSQSKTGKLLERAVKVAQAEGMTVDELATEAIQRELARRLFEKIKREAESRRGGMTNDEVERIGERAITEYRQGR